MKSFKIKKRTNRVPIFILEPPISSFPKPKLPLKFFPKIHQPTLFNVDLRSKMLQSVVFESVKKPEIID